jgi:hypothetical protein
MEVAKEFCRISHSKSIAMIKNIIIATLTIFSLISLYFAHIQRTKAEEMAELARSHSRGWNSS